MSANEKVVSLGIDIGTTYSSMSYAAIRISQNYPIPVPQLATDLGGDRLEHQFIPSLVCAYAKNKKIEWAVGKDAEARAREFGDKAYLYRRFKLYLGTTLPDPQQNVVLDGIPVNTDPGDLAKRIVEYMKRLAFGRGGPLEGCTVGSITVSTPSLWTEERKLYVEDLVRSVFPGTQVQSLEEPISALYHQISTADHLLSGPEKHVLVIDYGGGTCDVAVVRIKKDANRLQSEAKNVAEVIGRGSIERGGTKLDSLIVRHLNREFNNRKTPVPRDELISEAESLKIVFSNQIRDRRNAGVQDTDLLVYEAFHKKHRKIETIQMKENEFAELLKGELDQIELPITQAFNNARELTGKPIFYKNIHHVFLAGGTMLLPLVRDKVESLFKMHQAPVGFSEPDPRFAIVHGNARHAHHNHTRTGFGIGLTLQESIWLKGIFGVGIRIAKAGQSLPYRYVDYPFLMGPVKEVTVGLYRGRHLIAERNEQLKEPTRKTLTEPVSRLYTRFKLDALIRESGIIDFELKRLDNLNDVIHILHWVPTRTDINDMQKRAGIDSVEAED